MEKYPKTMLFRHFLSSISYLDNIPLKIKLKGKIKVHGNNMGVGYNTVTQKIWFQSRNTVITEPKEAFGFIGFIKPMLADLIKVFENFSKINSVSGDIVFFGEYCGKGLKKKSAINIMEKKWILFSVYFNEKFHFDDNYQETIDVLLLKNTSIKDIFSVERNQNWHYELEIDTKNPELILPKFDALLDDIDKQCPLAKSFQLEGYGEGIVWIADIPDHKNKFFFKTKTKRFSTVKVKNKVTIEPEVLNNINEFVDYSVTEVRLEQGVDEIGLDIKLLGKYISWINNDVYSEENDTLINNNLTIKQVSKSIADKARNYYLLKLK
jgi:hypothetical protein